MSLGLSLTRLPVHNLSGYFHSVPVLHVTSLIFYATSLGRTSIEFSIELLIYCIYSSVTKSLGDRKSTLLKNTLSTGPFVVAQPKNFKDTYQYEPLKDGEIRLFEIIQTFTGHWLKSPDIKLSLKMRTAKLSEISDKYSAMSYVWGDETKKCGIDVTSNGSNGEIVTGNLQINLNLLHALQQAHKVSEHSRFRGQSRLFWADAICINQAANEGPFLQEREKQVRIMHQIYSSASQVIVDLGPEDEYTTTAMEMIHKLDRVHTCHTKKQQRLQMRDLTRWNINAIHSEEDYLEMGIPLPQDKKWTAWVKLLARPWFRRIWVAQEYVAARSGVMVIGSEQMPLEHLAEHLQRVGELGLGEVKRPRGENYSDAERASAIAASTNLELLHEWRTQRREGDRISVVDALSVGHHFEMTRQVDRMYALLGMCDFSGDSIPYVSYTESVTEVYMRFNRYIIERNADDILVLLSAGVASPQGPSWSPDWSLELWNSTPIPLTFTRDLDRYEWRDGVYQGPPPVIFPSPSTNRNRYAFRAGGELKFPFTFSSDGKCLLAKGAILASAIRHVGPVFEGAPKGAGLDEHMEAWQRDERSARAWLKKLWNDPNTSTHSNALRKKQSTMPDLRRAYARVIIAATEEEYGMREHQDYLDGAWSAVSQHRWFERFGVIGPMPRDTLEYIQKIAGLDEDPNGVNESVAWDAFFLHAPPRTKFRRLCVTESGALALCPRDAREGDAVGLLLGAQVPYILRKKGEDYQLIGEAYVQDLMSGEGLQACPEICKATLFSIV
jgi:hypothetical protein